MKFIKNYIIISCITLVSLPLFSQTAPFEISIEPINISGLGGIQSYAYGQANGKWLIIGGRLDGLHRRQPWASFDVAGHNNQLLVVDPVSLQKWSAPLTSLPTSIQEQLSSTNMEFYQEGDYLYCIGGYGFSPTENDHTTFDKLTAIKVSDVVNGIINNTTISTFFRQITDTQFQVTGGRLKKINNTYFLLGGQKFIGKYNPMGPNNGPGFVQEYTNAIRKFNLLDDGTNISITHLPSHLDPTNLHRRDYNAEQQILPNGNEGITMFSGVFQQNVDLPFLNSVTVDDNNYTVNNTFQQYYNHYHCPVLPIYSEQENEMHSVFFGGIAQFYDNAGTLVQDDNVPFVNTIARVTRDNSGNMAEYKLPVEMPSLLGAGAEFIPNLNFPHFNNEVFKLDSVSTDNVLIGYIYGGISSSQPNIFFINDGTQSSANNQIFKVLIKKPTVLSVDDLNESSTNNLNLKIYPNPNDGILKVAFNLKEVEDVKLIIYDLNGKIIDQTTLTNLSIGSNFYEKEITKLINGSVYFISIETSNTKTTHKLVVKR
ncbi:T9SS type A sorting domain-containing protein [Brumimicrobium oceani]|uniref:T9SS C-terminal target domain-containing protein n=2 Tax=Brumimicrobium TaxID=200473 RepID=A0A2U2XBB6_9FLAO|nr:T9SS type A sorting domain-containing protein [Brumimicrobium oceani]PWH85078.1 T9SS C-terminal target domain-containing protein [Brumimicrobium oceani]